MKWFLLVIMIGCTNEIDYYDLDDDLVSQNLFFKQPALKKVVAKKTTYCETQWHCVDPSRMECVDNKCVAYDAWAVGLIVSGSSFIQLQTMYKGAYSKINKDGLSLDLGSFSNGSRIRIAIPDSKQTSKQNIENVLLEFYENMPTFENGDYENVETLLQMSDKKHGYLYGKMSYVDNNLEEHFIYTQLSFGIR